MGTEMNLVNQKIYLQCHLAILKIIGNGVVRSLAHEAQRKYKNNGVLESVMDICNGRVRPMDLWCMQTLSGQFIYPSISIGTGFLSEVDIDSERFRFLGGNRFSFYAAYKLITFAPFKAVISYKQIDNYTDTDANIGITIGHSYLTKKTSESY